MGKETNVFSIDKFSERLRELRGEKTLQEVADGIGITRVAMGYYEKGERKPDIEILFRIAGYYNVSADYLTGLSDVKTPDIDIKSISDKTGLAEDSINKIIKDGSDFLNFLISTDEYTRMAVFFDDLAFNYQLAINCAKKSVLLEKEAEQYPDSDTDRQQEFSQLIDKNTGLIENYVARCEGASYRLWTNFGNVLEHYRMMKNTELQSALEKKTDK